MELSFYQPLWWLLLVIILSLGFAYSIVNRSKWLQRGAFICRLLAVLALIFALCQPGIKWHTKHKHIIFLLDGSASVELTELFKAQSQLKEFIAHLAAGDSYDIILFANRARKLSLSQLSQRLKRWQPGGGVANFRQATNLSAALRLARLLYPADHAKQLVIISDGIPTDGDPASEIALLRRQHVKLAFIPLSTLNHPEVAVKSLTADRHTVYYGENLRLQATLTANRDMPITLNFSNAGAILRRVKLQLHRNRPKLISEVFSVNTGCSALWQVEVKSQQDYFLFNNRATVAVKPLGRLKLLLLHKQPRTVIPFVRALRHQNISIETRGLNGCPERLRELLTFDVVILSDFPATAMTSAQMRLLRSYVKDYGRGLIMTGSENSFGLGGYYRTPIEDVLPLISRYEKEKEQPALAIVLVIDKSGSMNGIKIALARQAGTAVTELLGAKDYIGVIAFDGSPRVIVPLTSAINREQVTTAINALTAGGGTNLYPAMAAAKKMLESSLAKIKHLIILSDGQSMPGDFTTIAAAMADEGITISTVALGRGAQRELMSSIAEIGGGRYYETMSADTVPRIFARETIMASRSAIREDPLVAIKVGDADYLDGIDFNAAPPLLGYVMTRAKPTAQVQLITENGDPLLASAQFGLGRGIGFTSDISAKWAAEWLDWRYFSKFWAQLIRYAAGNRDAAGLTITTRQTGDKVKVTVGCYDNAGRLLPGIKLRAILTSGSHSRQLPLLAKGYGRYQLEFKRDSSRNYTLIVNDLTRNKTKTIFFNRHYPREYQLNSQIPAALSSLPRFTLKNMSERIGSVTFLHPIADWLTIFALIMLLFSLLLRRLS